MEYNLKCRFCKKITVCNLKGFDDKKEQTFKIPCENCGKINKKEFPNDFKLEEFFKDFNDREKLFFQKYFLERKSLRVVARELNIPKSTIEKTLMKKFKLRSRKQAIRIYWRE